MIPLVVSNTHNLNLMTKLKLSKLLKRHRRMVLSLPQQEFMLPTLKKMATWEMGRAAKGMIRMIVFLIWESVTQLMEQSVTNL